MRRSARTAMAATLLALAAPASAQALTITVSAAAHSSGWELYSVTVTGNDSAESIIIRTLGANGFGLEITTSTPVSFSGPEACTLQRPDQWVCNRGWLDRLSGDLGGGDDTASVGGNLAFVGDGPIRLSLGAGNDRFSAASYSARGLEWSFDTGPGDDRAEVSSDLIDPVRVITGAGDDRLYGTPNDILDAGEGDDIVSVASDHDDQRTTGTATGGPGRDVLMAGQRDVALGLVLSGGVVSRGGGDGGTQLPTSMTGFEGLSVGEARQVRFVGDGGPNDLYACGGATLIGNGGNDRLYGNRRADERDGCAISNDPNSFSGGAGADEIRSRNFVAESVDCGDGVDTEVQADASDTLLNCEATGITFSAAPSGFVASRTATFAWDAPPGSTFECSLDGTAFAACTSPRTFTDLAEGEHGFRVRIVTAGQPGPPVEHRWTVDTVKPVVSFTQAPLPSGNPSDVDVAWEADEPATFACSEDGRPAAACSSPARLVGLAPGAHSLSVVATDRAGNVGEPAVTSWVVGGPAAAPEPPAPLSCPAGTQAVITVGVVVARAQTANACFRPAPEVSGTAFRARGPVVVNGLRITPEGGAFTIDRTLSGGEIATTGPWTLGVGLVNIRIPHALGVDGLAAAGVQVVQRSLQIVTQGVAKIADLPIRGAIGLEFSADNGGQSKVTANVELPRVFRGVPDGGGNQSSGGVTVEVSATASHDQGVFFSGRGRIDTLWLFGKLKLKNLEVAVDQGAGTFRGSVGLSLKDSTGGPSVIGGDALFTVSVEIGPDGLFGTPLRKFSLQASDLSVRVHPIVYLQRVGAELSAGGDVNRPLAIISGNAGISFGPKLDIPPLFEGEVASIDGTIKLSVPAFLPPDSFSLEVEGIGKLIEFQVAQAKVTYTTPARVEMEGRLDLTVGGYGMLGQIRSSWFDGSTSEFNVEAFGGLRVPGLGLGQGLDLNSEAVLSSRGFAVCAGNQGERYGLGRLWAGELQTFINACDLGGFRAGGARVAQARTVRVRRGTRVLAIAVRGEGAPKVELTGPGGARLATPGGIEPVESRAGLVVQDAERDTTWFVLRRPAAGTWRVNGPAVTSVDVADPLPPVRLRVRVTGRGERRVLTWRGLPSGHRLVLNELGSGTSAVVVRTTRARGRSTFRPAAGPGRARRLVATVTRRGLPRLEQTVARYAAPRPVRLRAVTRLRRLGNAIRWRAQPAASLYAVALRLADGSTVTRTVRRPRTTVPAAGRRGTVVVTVVALAADGRTGPATQATLRTRGRPARAGASPSGS